ncbi:unnamed protein product, partial [Vitis vinifera]|uniref:Disease resistance RPP13-like protein 1 n=1 Tax=Vitis vinifera TaxID=29760 RepID=D7T366_VITVI
MEAVGEALLSSFVQLLVSKLKYPSDLLKYARQEQVHRELKKWEETLSEMLQLLNVAEDKQINDPSVKAWLERLRDLAYDMEDILDEFGYEALRRKVEIITQSSWERRPVTTCEVYVPWVKGRDADKQIIIEMLLKDEPAATNVSVVSIVAMGGMGKTTLAKLVYDDTAEPIANHFALKAWVSVSIDFDKVGATKKLLNSLPSQSSNSEDFHEIQRQLKEALRGKRFLIVLDDLWRDMRDKWDDLRSPFLEAASGSKILVTTRDRDVAEWVGGPKNLHVLKPLSDDDCWSVFQTHAFQLINIHEHPNLESIGRRIVEKCGGLPLAAKALGGLLRAERREREWERVLDSKIWDLPDNPIIPALRLSYIHLPSHLKRCFAYCAIFPQDYEFMKEELIPLWMAEGLIQQSKDNRRKEDLGDKYFCELLSRSFFQSSSSKESLFVMHDLVNDLAKFVAGDTCLHLDDEFKNNLQCLIPESTRHSSFVRHSYDIFKKYFPTRCISYKVLKELIPRLGYLRVLSLSGYQINEIPNEFGNLKLLRYLNLSNTHIEYLPDSIGGLYNLQTLILSYCHRLTKLPINIGHLINLRHLDVSGDDKLQEMPSQIGKLKDLQQLWIQDCEQLESISEEMFHPTNNSLQSLHIGGYPNLKALPDCLNTLTDLSIEDFKNLELLLPRIKNLTCLTELSIHNCENIKTPLSQWGLSGLTSLKDLSIGGMFPDATSFSNDPRLILLPTTLTSLSISQFQNLESLSSLREEMIGPRLPTSPM